jgi:alpha-tubulin suppressor-like RCC1 family protein
VFLTKFGQLGLDIPMDSNIPLESTAFRTYDVTEISCGDEFTIALTSNGSMLGIGANSVISLY